MAFLAGTDEKGVVYFGPRDNPRRERYWAERGIIRMEDTATGEYHTFGLREFLQRLNGVSDMIGNSIAKDGFAHADEIKRNQDFVDAAMGLVERAKKQGLPPKLGGGIRRLTREFVGSKSGYGRVDGKRYRFD